MAQESLGLVRATNTLEPLGFGIPEALSHYPSVWAPTGVSGLFPDSPADSQVFFHMTRLFFMYYINTKPQLPRRIHFTLHFNRSQAEASYRL